MACRLHAADHEERWPETFEKLFTEEIIDTRDILEVRREVNAERAGQEMWKLLAPGRVHEEIGEE